jgi:lipoate-protein ligase A
VVRRLSGGGAVYHDLGNLNFSFITKYDKESLHNFKKFTDPVVDVLQSMGVDAELSGRNDLVVNDRKISGNAQFSTSGRMFSHGTLLFDTELGEVANALNVKMSKIESKGHKSVRSRVANISEFLEAVPAITEFRQLLLDGIMASSRVDDFETYELTDDDWEGVKQLRAERYGNWDWNYGKSPKFNLQRSKRFPIGEIDIRLDVGKGYIIEDAHIFGDFFGRKPVSELTELLTGEKYDRDHLSNLLEDIDLQEYFGAVDREGFLELLYGSDEDEPELDPIL